MHLIIASHSKLAQGIKETLDFFAGSISADVIEQTATDSSFEERLTKSLEEHEKERCIVFTDLYGGSVNQMAFKKLSKYDFYLITGMNLPLLLEIALKEDDIDEEFIRQAVENARQQLTFMNDLLK